MKIRSDKQSLRWIIMIPSFIFLLLMSVLVSMGGDVYASVVKEYYQGFIKYVGWSFGPLSLLFTAVLLYCMFSKVGNVRIGGEGATRILPPFSFFGVTITAITGTGLLFYGASEPVYHYMNPPAHVGMEPGAAATAVYSMGQTFMHWTLNMFSIYAILALGFSLVVYNLKYNFSASSILRPFLGKLVDGIGGEIIDLVLVFSMVLGNVWMLGQGLLSVSSGLESIFGLTRSGFMYFAITAGVLLVTLFALKSGIQKLVKDVANLTLILLFLMLVFFIIVGPLNFSLAISTEGLAYYFDNAFGLIFANGVSDNNSWPSLWTIAFYGSWAASGPIMALFLGKIGRGYTVREFLYSVFVGGACFYFLWFAIFGGTGIFTEITYNDIYSTIKENGFQSGIYTLYSHYPLSLLTSVTYIVLALLALITTLIAKLDAVSSMCIHNVNEENPNTPFWLKIIWGMYAGFMGWACATYLGFEGVRMFAGFAGIFGMFISLCGCIAVIWLIKNVEHRADGISVLSADNYSGAMFDLYMEKRAANKLTFDGNVIADKS